MHFKSTQIHLFANLWPKLRLWCAATSFPSRNNRNDQTQESESCLPLNNKSLYQLISELPRNQMRENFLKTTSAGSLRETQSRRLTLKGRLRLLLHIQLLGQLICILRTKRERIPCGRNLKTITPHKNALPDFWKSVTHQSGGRLPFRHFTQAR